MTMAKHRSKKQFNRAVAVTTAIIILIVASISTTIAFLITGTDSITNIFTPSKVTTAVVRSDEGEYSIQNVDDTEAYIRAAVVVNWKKADGTVYSKAPVEGTDYSITFNTNDWIKKDYLDGEVLYYHKSPVAPENTTATLISGVELKAGVTPPSSDYALTVEVLGSGIQSTPFGVVESKWGVVVDINNHNMLKFN